MAYNRDDYVRIKEEFSNKYAKAQKQAEIRRFELYGIIPELHELDKILSGTGIEIMKIISSNDSDPQAKIEELKKRNDTILEQRRALLVKNGYAADYTDVKYECEKCSDTGFNDTKMCECMKRELILAGYESSGIAELIKNQNFDNFDLEYYSGSANEQTRMKNYFTILKNFADNFNSETYCNFLMLGATGLGKTHLSSAVAKEVIDKGFDVLYVTAVGMTGDFEAERFGNSVGSRQRNKTSRYYEAELLIIDDLGTEVSNQFTLSCLYDVINTRINKRLCTFVNTNLTAKEIDSRYSERITSRLFGEYNSIAFVGTDIRKQKRLKNINH